MSDLIDLEFIRCPACHGGGRSFGRDPERCNLCHGLGTTTKQRAKEAGYFRDFEALMIVNDKANEYREAMQSALSALQTLVPPAGQIEAEYILKKALGLPAE